MRDFIHVSLKEHSLRKRQMPTQGERARKPSRKPADYKFAGVLGLLFGVFILCVHQPVWAGLAEQLSLKSDFIFKGTVQRINASTMAAVPATESTAVVRVDEIVQAKPPDDSFRGKEVTVVLRNPGTVKVGQQSIFFANDYLAGNSIAVTEIGQLPDKSMGALNIKEAIKSIAKDHALDPLRKRIGTSVVIVEGKVVETKSLPQELSEKPESDREPEWWTATIEVQSVYKGTVPDKKLTIRFSHNFALPGSPKFSEGQQGIFLLHHEKARMLPSEVLVALDPLDFQPFDSSALIKEIVQLQSIAVTSPPAATSSP